jgi:hypothetical protein
MRVHVSVPVSFLMHIFADAQCAKAKANANANAMAGIDVQARPVLAGLPRSQHVHDSQSSEFLVDAEETVETSLSSQLSVRGDLISFVVRTHSWGSFCRG